MPDRISGMGRIVQRLPDSGRANGGGGLSVHDHLPGVPKMRQGNRQPNAGKGCRLVLDTAAHHARLRYPGVCPAAAAPRYEYGLQHNFCAPDLLVGSRRLFSSGVRSRAACGAGAHFSFMIKSIKIADVVTDAGTQVRVRNDQNTIDRYAEAMMDATNKFPPIVVFHDGKSFVMADGFHRLLAAVKNGFLDIEADVRVGTQLDALKFALGANAAHGFQRNNEDKRRSVELALTKWPNLVSTELAIMCSVSHTFVDNIRRASATVADLSGSLSTEPPKRVDLDGKERRMPTKPPQGPPPPRSCVGPPPAVRPTTAPSGPPSKPPKPEPVLDKIGREIPDECLAIWNRASEVQAHMQAISAIRGALRQADKDKDPLYAGTSFSTIESALGQAYVTLKNVVPYTVCSSCQGKLSKNCRLCQGRGMISEYMWETAIPESQRNIILKTCCK
jgi:hypothetical protein